MKTSYHRKGMLTGVLLLVLLANPGAADSLEADRALLQAAGVGVDAAGLRRFFQERIVTEPVRRRIAGLIERLGADEFSTREAAMRDLEKLGASTRVQLTQAIEADDLEIRRRAKRLLEQLGSEASELLLYAPAARLLVQADPDRAVGLLLDFLPNIEEAQVAEETARSVLPIASLPGGKARPELRAALKDREPIRRLTAGLALAGLPTERATVLQLLNDPETRVRRAVARALVRHRERRAVPTLIDLLAAPDREEASEAESTLLLLAQDDAPAAPAKDTPQTRIQYKEQWHKWWKGKGAALDLARIDFDAASPGYTLVVTLQPRVGAVRGGLSGSVVELDRRDKERWRIDGLSYPVHVHKFRHDRMLVCEYTSNQVTERDTTGKTHWQYNNVSQLIAAERLRNGNTLIVSRMQVVEVDRDGKIVRSIRPMQGLIACHRHADGRLTMISPTGSLIELDRDDKEVRSVPLAGYRPYPATAGFRAHFLPGGGVLVPDYFQNRICEYDAAGKLVWEAKANRPTGVVRLRNGNVLSYSRLSTGTITEINRAGQVVGNRTSGGLTMYLDQR